MLCLTPLSSLVFCMDHAAYILVVLIYYYSPNQGALLWFKIGV